MGNEPFSRAMRGRKRGARATGMIMELSSTPWDCMPASKPSLRTPIEGEFLRVYLHLCGGGGSKTAEDAKKTVKDLRGACSE